MAILVTIVGLLLMRQGIADLVKTAPLCMMEYVDQKITIPCSTDRNVPVSWRYKSFEKDEVSYIFLHGDVRRNIQRISLTKINRTEKGQYDLVFTHPTIKSANTYQCQDNDGMDYGPTTELIMLKHPIQCEYAVSSLPNDTHRMQCVFEYYGNSTTDQFLWVYNNKQVKDCHVIETYKEDASSERLWRKIHTYCNVPIKPTLQFKFVAKFQNFDDCNWQWRWGENDLPEYNSTCDSNHSTDHSRMPYHVIVAGMSIGLCIVSICVIIYFSCKYIKAIRNDRLNTTGCVRYQHIPEGSNI